MENVQCQSDQTTFLYRGQRSCCQRVGSQKSVWSAAEPLGLNEVLVRFWRQALRSRRGPKKSEGWEKCTHCDGHCHEGTNSAYWDVHDRELVTRKQRLLL